MSKQSKGLRPSVTAIFSDATRVSRPSFATARKLLSKNLSYCIKYLQLTETLFANKVNTYYNDPSLISSTNMHQWLAGESIPSIYVLFKLSHYLKVSIDSLLKEDFASTDRVIFGRSYAEQVDAPKVIEVTTAINTAPIIKETPVTATAAVETTQMSNSNRVVKISRSRKATMESIVKERTSSSNANLFLAYAIYNSNMTLAAIAKRVGVSTRSLRDYAFYGTTVPGTTGDKIAKLFSTTTRSLGLFLNNETGRYEHMTTVVG